MANSPELLLVEDESEIARFVTAVLQSAGYAVHSVTSAMAGIEAARARRPAAIILDLGLPDGDGKSVIEAVRAWAQTPIIVLSARDQEAEKIRALEMGADDYLTKPFANGELLARIKVALRHANARQQANEPSYRCGKLFVDLEDRRATLGDAPVDLTPTEFNLLAELARHAGRLVTHSQLLDAVWGKRGADQNHYLRMHIKNLRRKLADDPLRPVYIFTEPGLGYRLRDAPGEE